MVFDILTSKDVGGQFALKVCCLYHFDFQDVVGLFFFAYIILFPHLILHNSQFIHSNLMGPNMGGINNALSLLQNVHAVH
jgi:hypothetical protein